MLLSLLHFSIHADTLELVLEDLHLPPAPLVFSALAQFLNAKLQSEAIMMEYAGTSPDFSFLEDPIEV